MSSLVRWDPFRDLGMVRDELARFMGPRVFGSTGEHLWVPPVDVVDDADVMVFKAELPEMTAEDVEIACEDDVLTIRGERSFVPATDESQHRIERSYGRFERSFRLPRGTQPDAITARFHSGILEIRVPKTAAPSPTKVPIAS